MASSFDCIFIYCGFLFLLKIMRFRVFLRPFVPSPTWLIENFSRLPHVPRRCYCLPSSSASPSPLAPDPSSQFPPSPSSPLTRGSQKQTVRDSRPPNVSVVGEEKAQTSPFFPDKSQRPFNLALPNARKLYDYDPEYPTMELLQDAPSVMKRNLQMWAEEAKENCTITMLTDTTQLEESAGILRQNQARIELRFDTEEARKIWTTGCDSDWNQGFSKCEFVATDAGTVFFRGTLSTEVVKDGRTERAGWASMRTRDLKSWHRKKYFPRWDAYSHLLIKCRGDGRSYKVMLHGEGRMDVTWGSSWSYPLHTHGGPYWQYEMIPFSRFIHTYGGRIQDKQSRTNGSNTSSVGIVLMDRIDGPFQLELAYIGVCHDHSHMEHFAYEQYSTPILHADSM